MQPQTLITLYITIYNFLNNFRKTMKESQYDPPWPEQGKFPSMDVVLYPILNYIF